MDAQEARVLVAVVVGSCVVHPVVPVGTQRWRHRNVPSRCDAPSAGQRPGAACHTPVQHVEVEPSEHALARPAGREGAAAAHHHVQHGEGDEVRLLQGAGQRSAEGTRPAWGVRARQGLTRKEQLSSPIMMCVSSGKGAGPRLTLDMSLSSCNQREAGLVDAL